jgi:hypothetical protein
MVGTAAANAVLHLVKVLESTRCLQVGDTAAFLRIAK